MTTILGLYILCFPFRNLCFNQQKFVGPYGFSKVLYSRAKRNLTFPILYLEMKVIGSCGLEQCVNITTSESCPICSLAFRSERREPSRCSMSRDIW